MTVAGAAWALVGLVQAGDWQRVGRTEGEAVQRAEALDAEAAAAVNATLATCNRSECSAAVSTTVERLLVAECEGWRLWQHRAHNLTEAGGGWAAGPNQVDIQHTRNPQECCERCYSSARGCRFWEWVPSSRECTLLESLPGGVASRGYSGVLGLQGAFTESLRTVYFAGVRDEEVRSLVHDNCGRQHRQRAVIVQGLDINDPAVDGLARDDYSCCVRCASTIGCLLWQWMPGGKCHLKHGLVVAGPARTRTEAGAVAGYMRRLGAPPSGFAELAPARFSKGSAAMIKSLLPPVLVHPSGRRDSHVNPVRGKAIAWARCPSRVDVSFVLVSKNEACASNEPAHCVHVRMRRMLRTVTHFDWAAQELTCEVVIVDWNSDPKARPLHHLAPPPSRSHCALRYITVPPELHRKRLGGASAAVLEDQAKNVGIRRANGRWIVGTNPDALYPTELLRTVARLVVLSPPDVTLQLQRVSLDPAGGVWHHSPRTGSSVRSRPCTVELGGNLDLPLSPRLSLPQDKSQPALACNGCNGDFAMAPCEAWARSRGYPEVGHTVDLDNEVFCWMEYGRRTEVGASFARHRLVSTFAPARPIPFDPPGCVLYHQYHATRTTAGRIRRPEWRGTWRACFNAEERRWWYDRGWASHNSTGRPPCWGACAEELREVTYDPTEPAGRRHWRRAMQAAYPEIDPLDAEAAAAAFSHDLA
eukprot:TRINITY_DN27128_c0_g1_i1.p1 TRINITY_DN27128_c0_g1~~TRINITY_DN27128_c0_g1_i1.p1  ORF type:complete len:722 (+),score=180.86 TRINITY_DN27128_c0_g1_i1:62-2167(+)